ncbi:diguanylate cyclase [Marinobacteraceae bacterium S3BR75-40.1]
MTPEILIVDDSVDNVFLLGDMLKDLGRVRFATEPRQAVALCDQAIPDLVLMDIEMPDRNGFELVRDLQATYNLESTSIIFVSIREREEDEQEGLKLGAVDYIRKPYSPIIVRMRVKKHLELQCLRNQLAEANRRLEALVHVDELTGAYNRRFFIRRLEQEIELFHRRQQPLSLVLLDVDDFKWVNDTWGHDAGDYALKRITMALQNAVRTTDFVCRIGGEEFAVILSATDEEESDRIAERIRQHMESIKGDREPTVWQNPGDSLPEEIPKAITASVGVATYQAGMSRDELIKAADRGSYAAKHSGKNRVVRL